MVFGYVNELATSFVFVSKTCENLLKMWSMSSNDETHKVNIMKQGGSVLSVTFHLKICINLNIIETQTIFTSFQELCRTRDLSSFQFTFRRPLLSNCWNSEMENATLPSWSDPIELIEIFQLKMNWSLVRVKQELSCERSHLSCFNLDPNARQAALPFDWEVESAARSSEPKESCGPLGPDRKSFSVAKVPPVNLNKSAAIRNFGSKEGATCEEAHGCNFPPIVMSWRWLSITHWADIFGCKCDITKLAINSYPLRNIRIRRYYAQQKLVCLDVFLYWERPARHCWNGKILLADDIFVRSAPKIGRGKYRIYFYTSNYFITIETSWVGFCFVVAG